MCRGNPERDISYLFDRDCSIKDTPCEFCKRIFNNSMALGNHKIRCPQNANRKIQKPTEEGLKRSIEKGRHWYQNGGWTPERRQKQSRAMKKAVLDNPDSYTANNVCGRVKIETYNGEKFHGKWELLVAKWLDQHSVKWNRKVIPLDYFWNDGWYLYFPDFYLPDLDLYIEVKGYETHRDRCKWSVLAGKISVLKSAEIKFVREKDPDVADFLMQKIFHKKD